MHALHIPSRRMRTLSSALLLLLPVLVLAPPDLAAQSPSTPHPTGSLDLHAALAAALDGNPGLAQYPYALRSAQARELQASLRPNPELGIDIENIAGSGSYRGITATETTLRLGVLLERGNKRNARQLVAAIASEQVGAEAALARLDVLANTTRLFIDLVESQAQSTLALRGLDHARALQRAAENRIASGAASELERHRAIIEVERARLETEHFEHLIASQRRQLAAQWGETAPAFSAASADLLALPELPTFGSLSERLARSPAVARFAIEQRLREAQLAAARAQAKTDPTVFGGMRHLNTSGDVAAVAYLLMPLPWRNRNQGAIDAAEADRARISVDREAYRIHADVMLFDLLQELKHAHTLVDSLQQTLIPEAEAAWMLSQKGYAAGRLSQRELIDAQKTRLQLESELLTNAADYHRYFAAIDRMTALAPADPSRVAQ